TSRTSEPPAKPARYHSADEPTPLDLPVKAGARASENRPQKGDDADDERAQRHHAHEHHDKGEQDPAAAADPPVRHRRPRLPRNARSHGLAARSHGLTARTHVLATGPDGLAARAHRLAARLRDLAAGPTADLPGPLIAGLDEPTAVIDEALPGAGLNESRPPQI